jgi:hypothetical protein
VTARSGGGGRHYFFRYPECGIKNSESKIAPGIDTRGMGGYVLLPPSNHKSGGVYTWMEGREPGQIELAQCPEWIIEALKEKRVEPAPVGHVYNDIGRYYLGKALASAQSGTRNTTGLWLANQLRDNGFTIDQTEQMMREYVQRCPGGDTPYTEREALATARSSYQKPAREPSHQRARHDVEVRDVPAPQMKPINGDSSVELLEYMTDIMDGKIQNVPFHDWPIFSRMTQALINGTITMVVGDPGVGKTFWILQNMLGWIEHGQNPACLFIEKNRRFHTHRLLAQLEGKGCFVDFDWVKANPDEVVQAMTRHSKAIDQVGSHIWSEPQSRLTLGAVGAWIRERAREKHRVIVVDPITAADAGDSRWRADEDFVLGLEKVVTETQSSLILVTHPKKGNRPGQPTGHDQAGGAAFFRFSDTDIWINRIKKPRKVWLRRGRDDQPWQESTNLFFQVHKSRNGRSAGLEFAFTFADGLKFAEQGVVIKDAKTDDDELEVFATR